MEINIEKVTSIHFVGIKGVAMTALAILAKEKGITVSGSDVEEVFPTDETLRRFGISYSKGFSLKNISHVDLIVYTGAHQGRRNIEVITAEEKNIPVLPHGKALGLFMEGKRGISVAGSHGKTTTSAMIAHVLTKAGLDPSFSIGCGEITSLRTSGHAGTGEYFVAEADEYVTDPGSDMTPRFVWQKPEVLVVTNIDFDHPDVYANLEAVQETFVLYIVENLSKNTTLVINNDDIASKVLQDITEVQHITYGKTPSSQYKISSVLFKSEFTQFNVQHNNQDLGQFTLKVPGAHNISNAVAALAALVKAGLSIEEVKQHLSSFTGTKRRFEFVVKKNDKYLYDDYAHHPTEIAATLRAARDWFPKKRIVAVFQPHTYSRTQALLKEFASCFKDADVVLLTDIYASAREKKLAGISGQVLFDEVRRHHLGSHFALNRNAVLQWLSTNLKTNDLIVTMGAGDIFTWIPQIKEVL